MKRYARWRLRAGAILLLVSCIGATAARAAPVGIRQIEFIDARGGGRHLALSMFYPTGADLHGAERFVMPLFTNLELYRNAPFAAGGERYPLVMFSHGRGSNGLYYAWFAAYLASHGFIVAALDHYRANTYDSTIAYLANKLWQRPVDLSLCITFLLHDPVWSRHIDAGRIGVAGHSQGGFTALWIGGAQVNPEKYLAFQRIWRNNLMVPAYLRNQLPLDPRPAMHVHDPRVTAVFAMAPGVIQDFGMDPAGLRQLTVPTYIIVGASDTQTPPAENAEFAAANIPHAELNVLPGRVGHEIFVNECSQIGRDELPEACIDAPGIDRARLHAEIGAAAVDFFGANLHAAGGAGTPGRKGGK